MQRPLGRRRQQHGEDKIAVGARRVLVDGALVRAEGAIAAGGRDRLLGVLGDGRDGHNGQLREELLGSALCNAAFARAPGSAI